MFRQTICSDMFRFLESQRFCWQTCGFRITSDIGRAGHPCVDRQFCWSFFSSSLKLSLGIVRLHRPRPWVGCPLPGTSTSGQGRVCLPSAFFARGQSLPLARGCGWCAHGACCSFRSFPAPLLSGDWLPLHRYCPGSRLDLGGDFAHARWCSLSWLPGRPGPARLAADPQPPAVPGLRA